jgi:hypothetical protein
MTNSEMSELGASWVPGSPNNPAANLLPVPMPAEGYVTRLHVRYDAQSFPEDLNFIETSDHESFQARYVMHHPFEGGSCSAAKTYRASLPARFKKEAENLANLTVWTEADIAARMAASGQPISGAK